MGDTGGSRGKIGSSDLRFRVNIFTYMAKVWPHNYISGLPGVCCDLNRL